MGRHLLQSIPESSTGTLTGGLSRLWGKGIILQGLQEHTSPQSTPCSRYKRQVCFIWESEGMGYLFSPVFLLLLCSFSSWNHFHGPGLFQWWITLERALFSGIFVWCLPVFFRKIQSCLPTKAISEKEKAMPTCSSVYRPMCTYAVLHII